MSLVGSLEDLDLGDILQIIHLSRKSGALQLQSSSGVGQILFCDGLIATAFCKGGPTDLRELLKVSGRVPGDALAGAVDHARARGHTLAEALLECGHLDAEAIDLARRAHAEEAVLRMFGWRDGEFSFEVREIHPGEVGELFIEPGLNPQFLALEGTRQFDESEHEKEIVFDGESDASDPVFGGDADPTLEPVFDGESDVEPEPVFDGESDVEAEPVFDGEPAAEAEPVFDGEPAAAAEVVAEALPGDAEGAEPLEAVAVVEAEPVAAEKPPAAPSAEPAAHAADAPIIVIDPALPVLEWVKSAMESTEARVHVFQTSELGISRIRQYLARREMPVVLISADAPADTLSGAQDTEEIVGRLRSQAPRMRVLVMSDSDGGDASRVRKPSPTELADPRAVERRMQLAADLRASLGAAEVGSEGAAPAEGQTDESVAELREVSSRMRDPESSGEVLGEVLRFAARSFPRVALFMVRDGEAVGLAQRGLAAAGGPDDDAFRRVRLAIASSPWLKGVIDTRSAQVASGSGEHRGDPKLANALGDRVPEQAFVAPIESSGSVVAIVYGDMLPEPGGLPNTGTLEVVLHQAGLALDRAALERVLDEG
ncbi:MAG: DUF4388 domain-containing protein [Myxococcota bacterium]|nr:DUF4388 domain-containing protein [Myxococcota bacterium]